MSKPPSLAAFVRLIVAELTEQRKLRTAENYMASLKSFSTFLNGKDIKLKHIDAALMCRYEDYLYDRGITKNTISFYMRILRAAYNRAVDRQLVKQKYPFRQVYTGVDKTTKRAIPISAIREIKCLDLSDCPALCYARDLFLFSFYTRGMSFVDMAYLKKSDLRNGMLCYRRCKTQQQLSVRWEACMQEIADRYKLEDTPYLLPILNCRAEDEYRHYKNASHWVNLKLKEIGALLKLPCQLTMYVTRHSWASIAKSKNVPLWVISDALGHDSQTTTQIYLSTLDTSQIDKANEMIINEIQENLSLGKR